MRKQISTHVGGVGLAEGLLERALGEFIEESDLLAILEELGRRRGLVCNVKPSSSHQHGIHPYGETLDFFASSAFSHIGKSHFCQIERLSCWNQRVGRGQFSGWGPSVLVHSERYASTCVNFPRTPRTLFLSRIHAHTHTHTLSKSAKAVEESADTCHAHPTHTTQHNTHQTRAFDTLHAYLTPTHAHLIPVNKAEESF